MSWRIAAKTTRNLPYHRCFAGLRLPWELLSAEKC